MIIVTVEMEALILLFVILFIGGLFLFIKFCGLMSSSSKENNINRSINQPKMKLNKDKNPINFMEAYKYLESTSPTDIFTRILPYVVYTWVINKPIDRFALITILAAINGPFKPEIFNKTEVTEFLELRNYQMNDNWYQYVDKWAEKYIRYDSDALYYRKIWGIIAQKDPYISELLHNHQFKNREYYIPELSPFGFKNEHWPRK